MTTCAQTSLDGRRHFWTTQPIACGTSETEICGTLQQCALPGLSVVPAYDDCDERGCYVATPESVAETVKDYTTQQLPPFIGIIDAFNQAVTYGYPKDIEFATTEITDAFDAELKVYIDPIKVDPDLITLQDAFGIVLGWTPASAGVVPLRRLQPLNQAALCEAYAPRLIGATIATNDFVRGLAINILMTDANKIPLGGCPPTPGRRGGYWADSYRTDKNSTGTKLRQLPAAYSIQDLVSLAQQWAQADLQKMISYGVATNIAVTATYIGGGAVRLVCEIDGETVSINGSQAADEWVWSI